MRAGGGGGGGGQENGEKKEEERVEITCECHATIRPLLERMTCVTCPYSRGASALVTGRLAGNSRTNKGYIHSHSNKRYTYSNTNLTQRCTAADDQGSFAGLFRY